uniref:Uncharacterized protein n=1 Tax=Arundo donax TaxID=35708 RepID=A0A0A9CIE0_ARUDO
MGIREQRWAQLISTLT